MFDLIDKTVFIPDANLYLDSRKQRALGFISHAHADHTANHRKIICSPPTADLLKARLKKTRIHPLPYDNILILGKTQVSLHPAGHVLGSAQILLHNDNVRLLYSGDFRTKKSRTAEPYKSVNCDVLIMETTFGREQFCFPEREEVENQLLELVTENLNKGKIPIIFAYPLGKAQEALHLLTSNALPVAADYSILRLAWIYEHYGIEFGKYEKFKRSEFRERVILLPANFRYHRFIKNMPDTFTIFLSGWGMDPSAKFRYQVDQVLPFSDHADFNELIATAKNSGAAKVYCTHGFDDFVHVLRDHGLNAHPLIPSDQTDLFD